MDNSYRPCECTNPGWCERHQTEKGKARWRQCKVRSDLRQLWDIELLRKRQEAGELSQEEIDREVEDHAENHQGPRGLGDTISNFLSAVGLTKKAAATLQGKDTKRKSGCGSCAARQEALNAAMPYDDEKKDPPKE